MTKVIGIDCHKWWMVTKISLWALTTIGFGYVAYIGYDNSFGNGRLTDSQTCQDFINAGVRDAHNPWCIKEKQPYDFYLSILPSIANMIAVWLVINWKLGLVELRCISRDYTPEPSTTISSNFISNDEYFKQQNPNEVKQE